MKYLQNIIYYIVVVFLIIYVGMLAISPQRMMDFLGFRTFIVLSDSMEPTINTNDMIITRRVLVTDIEEGDIITFYVYLPEMDQKSYVTHYVAKIEEVSGQRVYRTVGEGREEGEYDDWTDSNGKSVDITFSDIEGEYLFRIPLIGYVQRALSNKTFVVLLTVNAIVIYITIRYIRRDE